MINPDEYITPKHNLNPGHVFNRLFSITHGFIRHIIFKSKNSFVVNGERYNYFYHLYNMTWENERCVELPIVRREVGKYNGKLILEVGNVLSHYFRVSHDIVDKYEVAGNVINEDIVNFSTIVKYDLIVSISTIEHVGWDESPRDVEKLFAAVEKLKGMLNIDGRLMVTLPIGYNKHMDMLIFGGKLCFNEVYFLERIDRDCWIEANVEDMYGVQYGHPFRGANGLVVGIICASVAH